LKKKKTRPRNATREKNSYLRWNKLFSFVLMSLPTQDSILAQDIGQNMKLDMSA
jgi:hypothetical protein